MGTITGDPYVTDRPPRQWWLTCPWHRGLLDELSYDKDWIYCRPWGWHPADYWEAKRFFDEH